MEFTAGHEFVSSSGSFERQAPFGIPEEDGIIEGGSFFLELTTAEWIDSGTFDDIEYGLATGVLKIDGSFPIPWPTPLLDSDVRAS